MAALDWQARRSGPCEASDAVAAGVRPVIEWEGLPLRQIAAELTEVASAHGVVVSGQQTRSGGR